MIHSIFYLFVQSIDNLSLNYLFNHSLHQKSRNILNLAIYKTDWNDNIRERKQHKKKQYKHYVLKNENCTNFQWSPRGWTYLKSVVDFHWNLRNLRILEICEIFEIWQNLNISRDFFSPKIFVILEISEIAIWYKRFFKVSSPSMKSLLFTFASVRTLMNSSTQYCPNIYHSFNLPKIHSIIYWSNQSVIYSFMESIINLVSHLLIYSINH